MAKALRANGKVVRQGRKVVRGTSSACCCGSGTDPCECATGYFRECPDAGDDLCCSALEYDADITASGSCSCTVDPSAWCTATASTDTPPNRPGLFIGDALAVPDPAPDGGVLFSGTWSVNMVVSQRCSGGVGTLTTSGTLRLDYTYYGFREASNSWGPISDTAEITWTSRPAYNAMQQHATVSRLNMLPAGLTYTEPPAALFPFLCGPISACVEAYPNGSLLVAGTSVPWYGLIGTLGGAIFLPQAGYNEFNATASGSNTCTVRSNSARFDWTLYGSSGGDTPTQVAMGGATQEYAFSQIVYVYRECESDPCASGALGGL